MPTKTKKQKKTDPRLERIYETIDEELADGGQGMTDLVQSLLDPVDWKMVDRGMVREVFAVLFRDSREGTIKGQIEPCDEERRNALGDRADREHSLHCRCCEKRRAA